MGFMEKVTAAVKSGAGQAATRAQEEYDRLQAKRDLGQAYCELGEKTFQLIDRGDLSHSDLAPLVERVRLLQAQLAAIGADRPEETEASDEAPSEAARSAN